MQKASMVELQICMSEEMQGISQSPSLLLSPSPSLACYSSGNSTLAEIAARVAHEMSLQEDGLEGDVGVDAEELFFHQSETELPRLDEEDEETADAEDRGDKGGEFEFAFVCGAPESAPISADEIFHNGKIRPMYDYSPVTNSGEEYEKQRRSRRPQLKLLMREEPPETGFSCSSSESDELDGAAPGTYCVWIPREQCRKSSSTGSGSRRWKLKHLLLNRSNSDGRTTDVVSVMPPRKAQGNDAAAGDGGKAGGSPDGGRRWSFLPHRTDVVGFFANVNGLNRNLHPFK